MATSNSKPPASSPPLDPLRIVIGGFQSPSFKSIGELIWDNIPPLAILTGVNGSGKTQLLELLAYRLINVGHPQVPNISNIRVDVTGTQFRPGDITYLPNTWEIASPSPIAIGQIRELKRNLYRSLREARSSNDIKLRVMLSRIEQLLGTRVGALDEETFVEQLPDDYSTMIEEADITLGLGNEFLTYRLRAAQEFERGTLKEDIPSKIGPAPWDVLNETLRVAEFPYRVNSPMDRDILDNYNFQLINPESDIPVRPLDLSSGEKIIFALVLWLYKSQRHGRFPRLFLLDEPDAHLHPSMTRQFMNVIKEVLVEKHNVRVIMTTHSPSTVALAPDGSVFEMSRTPPRITPSKSKAHTIGLLTAGMVIVSASTRYVLVEDKDDVDFYSTIRDILSDYGPSRDPKAIKPSPSIAFLPASLGTGKGKVGGGKSVVTQWVEKFNQEPLDQIFRGIIDRDTDNTPTPRIHVLSRYSIENYLLDPFVVFGVLLDQGTAPAIPGVSVSQGDEHRIRALPESELQAIAAAIQSIIEPTLSGLTTAETAPREVTFTNGKKVAYPSWMLDRRGHDLIPLYQSSFGGTGVLSPPRLYRSLRRVRLIPAELADIMEGLQN